MESPSTDKKRLSQVQTQDLTESRLNDDFVFWLKKHGMNTLLAVLIAACAFLGYDYWRRTTVDKTAKVWSDLAKATQPVEFETLAKEHADVPQAAMLALLQAGDLRLRQLQSGVDTAAQGTTPAVPLDDAGRKIAQDAADEDYAKAADLAKQVAGSNRAGVALVTQLAQDLPGTFTQEADHDLPVGERGVVIGNLAQARCLRVAGGQQEVQGGRCVHRMQTVQPEMRERLTGDGTKDVSPCRSAGKYRWQGLGCGHNNEVSQN